MYVWETSKGFWILHIRQIWTWAKWNLLLLMHKVSFYVENSIYSDFIIILNSCYIEFIIFGSMFLWVMGYVKRSTSFKYWYALWENFSDWLFLEASCIFFLKHCLFKILLKWMLVMVEILLSTHYFLWDKFLQKVNNSITNNY